MISTRSRVGARHALAAFFIFFLLAVPVTKGQDKDWRPVTPAELQMKTGQVETDADAEAIFWEVRIDDSSDEDLFRQHYVRVKIFTERGREKYSKFDIPFAKGTKIKDLAARVIKADGSIVDVKKEDILEREIVRANGIKVRAKSFAVPNIEPGVIVEYRYKESINDAGAMGMQLQFQRDIPVQNLTYYYRPYNGKQPATQAYNFADVKFEKDKGGFYVATRTNVPALREEPQMPPDDMVRAWMLLTGSRLSVTSASSFSVSYVVKDPSNVKAYWGSVASQYADLVKFMNKSNGDVKAAAEQATAGAQTDDEKLRKLYEFCQTQIANTTFDPSITDDQRKKLPETKSIGDVLKRRSASSQFVDMLFGSMASSLGFETRIGLLGNRSQMFFHPKMTNESLVHLGVIAIKIGDKWKFFNPGMKFLPYGMLVWYEEDTWALLASDKQYSWENTPYTPYDQSNAKRTGKFKLSEDGTLEGDVTLEYTGQPAVTYRAANYDEGAEKREESFQKEIKSHLTTAEVSSISIENVTDPSKPLIKRYKIRVPNYAQKTGKRLFLQPGFFEYGVPAVFSGSSRKYDLFFHYPWSENDSVEIAYPQGYDLDNADAPATVADPENIGGLDIKIMVNKATNTLEYKRVFHFGGGGNTLFKVDSYQPLKNLFDMFQKSDSHTITLKQK
ncbi:MAG: DUF3857 domain-containing protein [Acidobacteriota bacterium]